MEVDMRHTKLKAEEAAILAGEVEKPSWASRNEGIHERVSFEDTIWGFELAGGAFYKTPIRVVYVKPGSRADQACIKLGDTVLRINDIDTSTLTLQEAHKLIIESGIHLRISVTSPDDDVDAYYVYKDPTADADGITDEMRRAMEAERIRKLIEKATRHRDLEWPWVRRKIIIYRESNCFLVPSKYEAKHQEQFPELPHIRYMDDISDFHNAKKKLHSENKDKKDKAAEEAKQKLTVDETKQHHNSDVSDNELGEEVDEEFNKLVNDLADSNETELANGRDNLELQEVNNDVSSEKDFVENHQEDEDSVEVLENGVNGFSDNEQNEDIVENNEEMETSEDKPVENGLESEEQEIAENLEVENSFENKENDEEEMFQNSNIDNENENTNEYENNKDVEVLENGDSIKSDEDKIVDGIIHENGQYEEIMESLNER